MLKRSLELRLPFLVTTISFILANKLKFRIHEFSFREIAAWKENISKFLSL